MLGQARQDGSATFAITYDISSAYRIVRVQRRDWGRQGCRVQSQRDLIDFNTCCTFGVAPAGMWFGRLMAAVVRGSHYCMGSLNAVYHLLMRTTETLPRKGTAVTGLSGSSLFTSPCSRSPSSGRRCTAASSTKPQAFESTSARTHLAYRRKDSSGV